MNNRFPRIEEIRSDKDCYDCMTAADLSKLTRHNEGKLTKRHLEEEEEDEWQQSKAAKRQRTTISSCVDSIYRPSTNLDSIKRTSKSLQGKVMVVEPLLDSQRKKRLEEIIAKHGGIVEQNPAKGKTWAYIQTGGKARARNVIKEGYCNVIKESWLMECLEKFRPLRPADMIFTTEETQEAFDILYDQFGDSYGFRSNLESLKYSMDQVMQQGKWSMMTSDQIADFEAEYDFKHVYGLFRSLKADFHDELDLEKLSFQFYGGQVENTNYSIYFVPDDLNPKELKLIKAKRRNLDGKPYKILMVDWIRLCIEKKDLINEQDFLL